MSWHWGLREVFIPARWLPNQPRGTDPFEEPKDRAANLKMAIKA
jgi:hypothetical protein